MTFKDLPPDWRHHALTDPALTRNVIDLYCTAGDRSRGALTLVICDEKNHFKGALVVDLCDLAPDPTTTPTGRPRRTTLTTPPTETPPPAPHQTTLTSTRQPTPTGASRTGPPTRTISRSAALRPVIRPLQVYPGGALILALGRRGPGTTTKSDREWADAAVRVCRSLGVRLLGFYLASRDTVFPADLTTATTDLPTAA
ncbi:hypothetical protein [Kribbella sp. DT2]|uniref:hypothetical protein n=1 Tax=Kribbella sp. DT2 TaxID=3393427 RepID=UPI003CF1D256